MIRALASLALTATLFAAGPDAPKVPRAKIVNTEKMINTKLASMYPEEPYFLIGMTRGLYLDGVGAIFSAEVNIAMGPSLSPFKQTITKEEIARHHDKKEVRIPLLRTAMYSLVSSMGSYLETLPTNEEFVLAISLPRYPWEDPIGTPSQIVMRVPRGKLVQAERDHARPDTVIKLQEY